LLLPLLPLSHPPNQVKYLAPSTLSPVSPTSVDLNLRVGPVLPLQYVDMAYFPIEIERNLFNFKTKYNFKTFLNSVGHFEITTKSIFRIIFLNKCIMVKSTFSFIVNHLNENH